MSTIYILGKSQGDFVVVLVVVVVVVVEVVVVVSSLQLGGLPVYLG